MKRESLCGEDVDANLGAWGVGRSSFVFGKKKKKKKGAKTFFPSSRGDERGRG
jgi:hypothetical protein